MPTLNPAPIALVEPPGHAHAADLETCLDLVNTLELTNGVPEDELRSADDGLAWLSARGLGHEEPMRAQAARDPERWLGRLRDVRAALREVWDAEVGNRPPGAAAVAVLNGLLARAPRTTLRATATGIAVEHSHVDADPTGEALARVAQTLVDAVAAGSTGRFRVCANDGCRWVFEDTSRAGRRRWCDMATCGNRAKARRHRSRLRAGEGQPAADP
jgi:predicted RNA-binding Zn ribbon-like protein